MAPTGFQRMPGGVAVLTAAHLRSHTDHGPKPWREGAVGGYRRQDEMKMGEQT